MKQYLLIGFLLFSFNAIAQDKVYDSSLAKKLGADKNGMKSYILVLLKTGPNKTTNKHFIDSCFAGHMQNMGVMVKANQLVVAGPLGKNDKTYRGIFILNLTSIEEAEKLLLTDPAISSGLLATELYKWYGSAALAAYLPFAEKISQN
ncbi:YciI family protein [Sediminibacterium sp.]|uniref:YciI family protein n=1 Tax=Sediminibacterium sp. TaxID=1917865 RepID=UPI003F6F812E